MDLPTVQEIQNQIHLVRENQILIDSDLADLFKIKTSHLNRSFKQNKQLFPITFAYQLTQLEWENLLKKAGKEKSEGRGGRRTLPFGFTEEGVAMLSTVLNNTAASNITSLILKSFSIIRQNSGAISILAKRIESLEKLILQQLHATSDANQSHQQNRREIKGPFFANKSRSNNSSFVILFPDEDHLTITTIYEMILGYYKISEQQLKSRSRATNLARSRHMLTYLLRNCTSLSLSQIGTLLGGRDHTTILHGYNKIESALLSDANTRIAFDHLRKQLEAQGISLIEADFFRGHPR